MSLTVSICIANYRQDQYLKEAIDSCKMQTYPCEIHVYNDLEGVGSGEAFNRAIAMATGAVVILLCADDLFTDKNVISDIVECFKDNTIGHVSRYYYQFIDGDRRPVRAWRGKDVLELANNPSGLAFRRMALESGFTISSNSEVRIDNPRYKQMSNLMFVEAPALVSKVIAHWSSYILEYDTIAVRVHQSTAQNKDYYLKMWSSSPVEEWNKLGGSALLKDYTSLVQIKNNFKTSAVIKECWNFVKYKPINLLAPGFWFYAIISILTPRIILRRLPDLYRKTFGRWLTREVKRP